MSDVVKNLKSLIGTANSVTGKTDRDMTAATQSLLDGYGKGGPTDEQLRVFWENVQDGGKRTDYTRAFQGPVWEDSIFRPLHDIRPTAASFMLENSGVTDLASLLKQQGVVMDLQKAFPIYNMIHSSAVTALPAIDASKAGNKGLGPVFYQGRQLRVIENMILNDEGTTTWPWNTFEALPMLEEITVTGKIGQNLSISGSAKLSERSVASILAALKDVSGDPQKLTLHKEVKKKISPEQIRAINTMGWTLA